jgi:hypothetical protein
MVGKWKVYITPEKVDAARTQQLPFLNVIVGILLQALYISCT